jgi:hypothetical protein
MTVAATLEKKLKKMKSIKFIEQLIADPALIETLRVDRAPDC